MASASLLLSEEQFLCSICLDLFTDPVTIPCGHNYCRGCITRAWEDVCRCPLCKETFQVRPKISVNIFISEMVQQFRSQKLNQEYDRKTEAEIRQMIRDRHVKIREVKRSVELSKKDTDAEIEDGVQIFTILISSIERHQKTVEKQVEGFAKELQQEIILLEKRSSELKRLSHTEDHLQNFASIDTPAPTKDWTKVSVRPSSCVGTVRVAVAQLEKPFSQEMEKRLCDIELRRIQQYAVDVTLDPDTAHPRLILSEDGKQLSHGIVKKNLPNNKERFSYSASVLGKQSFSSGRFYYEVQGRGKTRWIIGVVEESIDRKGPIYRDDYWTLWLGFKGNEYEVYAGPDNLLPVRENPQTVGVFVDYEEGLVSFYDVEARVHLYSFNGCTFTERLYPYFNNPCRGLNGTNSAPLIISPVNRTD